MSRISLGLERLCNVAVVVLLAAMVLQAGSAILCKSPGYDETGYLGSGAYLLRHQRWDISHVDVHPSLFYYLNGFPLLFLNIPDSIWQEESVVVRGQKIISLYPNDLVLHLARAPMLIVSLLLGYFVYRWARELHGVRAGLFALLLYAFEPNLLAFSGSVTPDILITFFIFVSLYCFRKLINRPRWLWLIATGVSCGLTFLSRHNGLFLVPIFILIALALSCFKQDYALMAWGRMSFARRGKATIWLLILTSVFMVAMLVVWAGYGFETGKPTTFEKRPHVLLDANVPEWLRPLSYTVAEHVPLPFPTYIRGAAGQFTASRQFWQSNQLYAFLLGNRSRDGWWYYYLVAYVLKTPIPLLICLLFGLWAWWRERKARVTEGIFLLLPAIFFFGYFSFLSKLNLGFCYLMPMIPLLIVLVSPIVTLVWTGRPTLQTLGLFVLLAWYVLGSLWISPHYFSYFNEFIGGPDNGYKYLVEKNLDWGQDLKGLKKFMDARKIDRIKLAYFGTADPRYYGIDYDYLPSSMTIKGHTRLDQSAHALWPSGPVKGIIAISATELQGLHFENKDEYAWLKAYQPVAKIGYSIFIYDIR